MNYDEEEAAARKILSAGNIPCTDEKIMQLWLGESRKCIRGLSTILGHFLVLRRLKKSPPESAKYVAEKCDELQNLMRKARAILDGDRDPVTGRLTMALYDHGADTTTISAALHRLEDAAGTLSKVAWKAVSVETVPSRAKNVNMWVFFQLYRLYCSLSGKSEIGINGPLYRFVKESVALFNILNQEEIKIPTADSFRKRLVTWKKAEDAHGDFSSGKKLFHLEEFFPSI